MATEKNTPSKPKETSPSFTREELEALLYAATNRDPLVGANYAAGESATAKLREALEK